MNQDLRRIEQSNFRHLVMDIAWFGLAVAATSRFLQFYAIRMGATPMELGWLAALPSLVLVIATALSQWWRSRYDDSVQAVIWPGIGQRLVFLLPAFAPFFPHDLRIPFIIFAATIPALAQGIASTVFVVMMRETVTHERLTPLMNRRFLALNVMVMLGALGFGLMLEAVPYPYNYQLMFVAAFAFSLVSSWHITRLHALQPAKPTHTLARTRNKARDLLKSPQFQSVAYVTLICYVTFYAVFAIVPLHLESSLGATEGFMAMFSIAELLAGAAITFLMPRWVDRFGNRTVVAIGMLGTGIGAAAIALSPVLWPTLIAAMLIGASWTIVSIGVFGFFAERTAPDDMQATTLFHQIMFMAMFIGPLLGSGLVNGGYAVTTVLIFGAIIRILAGILTHFGLAVVKGKRVQPVRQRGI